MGGLVALGVALMTDREGLGYTVGTGVVASLFASVYVLAVGEYLLGGTGVDIERLEEAAERLERGAVLLEHAREHGALAVKPKSRYAPDEWIALLDAREDLYIVGHALHKWCRDDVRGPFVAAVERLVRAGKRVQLVILPLDGEVTRRIGEQRGKDYHRRVEETLDTLAAVYRALPERKRALLDVRQLCEEAPMPYMLAGNEDVLVTAPYPIAADSDTIFALTVDAKGPLGAAILDDLKRLVASYSEPVDLNRS